MRNFYNCLFTQKDNCSPVIKDSKSAKHHIIFSPGFLVWIFHVSLGFKQVLSPHGDRPSSPYWQQHPCPFISTPVLYFASQLFSTQHYITLFLVVCLSQEHQLLEGKELVFPADLKPLAPRMLLQIYLPIKKWSLS